MVDVYIVRFWKLDEPYHLSTEFSDGAKASDFITLKQSEGFLTSVTIEQRKQKQHLKVLLKKVLKNVGSGLMNAGNNDD